MKTHLSVSVTNLEKSIQFYNALLNSEPVKLKHNYAKYLPENSLLNLSLNVRTSPIQTFGSINHGGFQFETLDEVLKAKSRMEDHGFSFKDELGVTCCYAKQDKFWVQDPDGFNWEIYVLLEDVEREDDSLKVESTNCCVIGQCNS